MEISVSKICLGTLTVGPLQANLSVDDGAEVIYTALCNGINFLDTAQSYNTYPYIKKALDMYGRETGGIVISTKTYAHTRELAKFAVEEAMNALGREYIDIFMLHEQEDIYNIYGHEEALLYLLEAKKRGYIHHIGLSTHYIDGVWGTLEYNRENGQIFDVVHPIINYTGLGILSKKAVNNPLSEMETALKKAKESGLFILAMKALGGGNLYKTAKTAFDYILKQDFIDSIAVGMRTKQEVAANLCYLKTGYFPNDYDGGLQKKSLFIEEYCTGCGSCINHCPYKALSLNNGRTVCDADKCILCGYCAKYCGMFAIKML